MNANDVSLNYFFLFLFGYGCSKCHMKHNLEKIMCISITKTFCVIVFDTPALECLMFGGSTYLHTVMSQTHKAPQNLDKPVLSFFYLLDTDV